MTFTQSLYMFGSSTKRPPRLLGEKNKTLQPTTTLQGPSTFLRMYAAIQYKLSL